MKPFRFGVNVGPVAVAQPTAPAAADEPTSTLRRGTNVLNKDCRHPVLVAAGKEIPLSERTRWRWDAGKAIERSVRAIDLLLKARGGHALFLDNPIQRAWRDVRAIRTHTGTNPECASFILALSEFGFAQQNIRF